MSELSRIIDLRAMPTEPQRIEANGAEREALARRFGLVAINHLIATVTLTADGQSVRAIGRFDADIVQPCAVSGEDLAVHLSEPVALRFVPALDAPDPEEEIEMSAADLDDIEMEGGHFDLGEAIAQSLALAIDPYLTGPQAEEARRKSGIVGEGQSGPFAALAALKKKAD